MKKLSVLLRSVQEKQRPMVLIASLPANDPALVKACLRGGADVIKVHINLQHRASRHILGGLKEERPALLSILELCKNCPCGIVPGADPATIDAAELRELTAMGFDFLSLYLHDAPLGKLPPSDSLEHMLAIAHGNALDLVGTMDDLDVQVVEASIMAKETYGNPLTYYDLLLYRRLRSQTRLPLVVPSQHSFTPDALPEMYRAGIEAVMLGSIVAGETPEDWENTFLAFRAKADEIFKNCR